MQEILLLSLLKRKYKYNGKCNWVIRFKNKKENKNNYKEKKLNKYNKFKKIFKNL